MKDLKFDNQRGASMACDLVDVVRARIVCFPLAKHTMQGMLFASAIKVGRVG